MCVDLALMDAFRKGVVMKGRHASSSLLNDFKRLHHSGSDACANNSLTESLHPPSCPSSNSAMVDFVSHLCQDPMNQRAREVLGRQDLSANDLFDLPEISKHDSANDWVVYVDITCRNVDDTSLSDEDRVGAYIGSRMEYVSYTTLQKQKHTWRKFT